MYEFAVVIGVFSTLLGAIVLLIGKFKSWVYVLFLMITASWLLLFPQLLSPYVIGIDSHYEVTMAKLTLNTGHWYPDIRDNVVNAALSITVFTPAISMITGISIWDVIKFILTIYSIISIPFIFLMSQKYLKLSSKLAFLSSMLVIGSSQFMLATVYARQEVASFIAIIILYLLLSKCSSEFSKSITITIMLLIVALIFAHYSTAILFIGCFIATSLVAKLINKMEKLRYVLFSFVFLILWLIYIVYVSSRHIIYSIYNIFFFIINFATDKTSDVIKDTTAPTFNTPVQVINYITNISIILLFLFGVTYCIYCILKKKHNPILEYPKYILFSFIMGGALFTTLLPYVSMIYNPERIYITALLLCGGFSIIGLEQIYKIFIDLKAYIKKVQKGDIPVETVILILATVIILLHFVLQIGILPYFMYGDYNSKYFNDISKDFHYTLKEEGMTVMWIQENIGPKSILFTDYYGRGALPLQSIGMFNKTTFITVKDLSSIHADCQIIFYQQKSEIVKKQSMYTPYINEIEKINIFLSNCGNLIYNAGNTTVHYI